jgi:5-methylcytosine-specific restriction enzyme subunit McrC
MSAPQPHRIELTEYEPQTLAQERLSAQAGETLWRNYSSQVAVEAPSFKTNHHWVLTAHGWVGHIPLTPDLHVVLLPRVELGNLFRMLVYAYDLTGFRFLDGLITSESLAGFYEQLAEVLAQRVLDRTRRGLYRAYLAESDQLPYVRGRLEARQLGRQPGHVTLPCHYHDHTADIEDNQILAWTLYHITRTGICSERVLPLVRRAYRALQSTVEVTPFNASVCVGRLYHRLNDDYQPMHAICRFFLEQSGPGHRLGDRTMLPFLVNMTRLYELFVAEWLKTHLPSYLRLKVQEKVDIDATGSLHFRIDVVLYDVATGMTRRVLDTKYKTPKQPSTDDVSQVTTYAIAKNCPQAVLVYPVPLTRPLDETIGNIRVRSLTFALDGDLERAGERFMAGLLS